MQSEESSTSTPALKPERHELLEMSKCKAKLMHGFVKDWQGLNVSACKERLKMASERNAQ